MWKRCFNSFGVVEYDGMNLHEYQSKSLLGRYGLPVPKSVVAQTVEEAVAACDELGGGRCVVKAQVHAGGRGKAGGVKVVENAREVAAFARQWLGKRLRTYQTTAEGQPVNHILVEECTDVAKELYLGAVIDRASERIVFIASTEGGVDIEDVARDQPEKVLRAGVDFMAGAQPYQGRALGYSMGLNSDQVKQLVDIFTKLARLFVECDLSLLEINPLVIARDGSLCCLDAKISVDNNALYRQKEMAQWRDTAQEDEREIEADRWGLSYVALDGNIGCMVNGAGLAMGTMDVIKAHGGNPANFLDVGGSATRERVVEAFKIILSDRNVRSVLVNIFGGIVRCDLIAEGIIGAVQDVGIKIPVVVRLEGNNAQLGLDLLAKSGLDLIAIQDLDQASRTAVEKAK